MPCKKRFPILCVLKPSPERTRVRVVKKKIPFLVSGRVICTAKQEEQQQGLGNLCLARKDSLLVLKRGEQVHSLIGKQEEQQQGLGNLCLATKRNIRMTEYKRYRNSFYNPKRFSSQEWITARLDESPEEYKGILSIVNKDVCIGMCAGINGAKL